MNQTRMLSLAAIVYETGFHIDNFPSTIAKMLSASGIRLGGVIQRNLCESEPSCSRMVLVDLTTGTISQDLGSGAQGCRLDPGGLAGVGASLEATIDHVNF